MKITRRVPRIKIGDTTYTFGKNGVSSSTEIIKGIRLRRSANGKRSIGGSFLFWRWAQDLDEIGRNKSPAELKQIREQRKNELSLGLLLLHPILFLDHLFRRRQKQLVLSRQKNTPSQPPVPVPKGAGAIYSANVSIYKSDGDTLKKVTRGMIFLEQDKIVIKANVTKEIFYSDISDVHIESGKIFITSNGRNIPLIVESYDTKKLLNKLTSAIIISGGKHE